MWNSAHQPRKRVRQRARLSRRRQGKEYWRINDRSSQQSRGFEGNVWHCSPLKVSTVFSIQTLLTSVVKFLRKKTDKPYCSSRRISLKLQQKSYKLSKITLRYFLNPLGIGENENSGANSIIMRSTNRSHDWYICLFCGGFHSVCNPVRFGPYYTRSTPLKKTLVMVTWNQQIIM